MGSKSPSATQATSRSRPLAGWLFAVAIALSSCRDAPPVRFRIGVLLWPPYEIAYLARSLGYLEGSGVELVDYTSPAVLLRDYQNGDVDAATFTIDYALALTQDDDGHRIVLTIDTSNGGDAILAKPPITKMSELRGKRVGMEASALGAFVLSRALEIHGIDHSDIEVVPVDLEQQQQMFAEGQLDAVTTYEPVRTRLLRSGARELFSSREIPGEIIDVLVTRTQLSPPQVTALRAFLAAWFKGIEEFERAPEEAATRVVARQRISVEEYLRAMRETQSLVSLEQNQAWLSGTDPGLMNALQRTQDFSLEKELLHRRGDLRQLLDASHLP